MAYRNTIPVFVNHHHTEQHAKCEEEQAVDVVFDSVTYCGAEGEKNDLGNCEERRAENDITDGPPVFEGTEYQDEL